MRWSQLRHRVEEQLAPSLRKDVRLFLTNYAKGSHFLYHAYIEYKKQIVWDFSTSAVGAEAGKDGVASDWIEHSDFTKSLRQYLTLSIDDCLLSDNLIIQALATWDARLGKRRISRLAESADLPTKTRLFLDIRRHAEGFGEPVAIEKTSRKKRAEWQFERAFIGLTFGEELRQIWQKFAEIGKLRIPKARWLAFEDLHLTLHFLGNITQEQRLNLNSILQEHVVDQLSLAIGSLKMFPKRPDFFYLQVTESSTLTNLRSGLATAIGENGIAVQKDFSPHITLARLPKSQYQLGAQFVADQSSNVGSLIPAAGLRLMCRDPLASSGRRYQVLP